MYHNDDVENRTTQKMQKHFDDRDEQKNKLKDINLRQAEVREKYEAVAVNREKLTKDISAIKKTLRKTMYF
ncbi:hypothetical protein AGMMS49921_13570 [Endomicrobiia bacterium]|nr:hypothetical protein AGMMS49921_13570 [Endomicrobiia bacterium]